MLGTGSSSRVFINPIVISSGKINVLRRLEIIENLCREIQINLTAEEADYTDCVARIYVNDYVVEEEEYKEENATHAEMNALAKYIKNGGVLAYIDRIEITAPPCKSCAFVLNLLGVINKVHTTKNIHKHATGSWKWHDRLQNLALFNLGQWNTIKRYFDESGLNDRQILDEVIKVVQSRSPL